MDVKSGWGRMVPWPMLHGNRQIKPVTTNYNANVGAMQLQSVY